MRLFRLGAVVALCAALGACSTVEGWIGSASGPTSAPMANTIQMGGHLYVAAKPIASAYIHTAACDRTCRDTIDAYSQTAQGYLDQGFAAEARGDNAAVAVALTAFNAAYAALFTYLTGAGQAVPTS